MGLFGRTEAEAPPDPIKEAGNQINQLMQNYDLFGVADLLCKSDPKDWQKIGNVSRHSFGMDFKPDGSFEFRLGDDRFRSVRISPEYCKNQKK